MTAARIQPTRKHPLSDQPFWDFSWSQIKRSEVPRWTWNSRHQSHGISIQAHPWRGRTNCHPDSGPSLCPSIAFDERPPRIVLCVADACMTPWDLFNSAKDKVHSRTSWRFLSRDPESFFPKLYEELSLNLYSSTERYRPGSPWNSTVLPPPEGAITVFL